MASGVLGGAVHTENFMTYSGFRTALGLDRQSSSDNQAFASLPTGSTIPLLINRTANNPAGVGSATPYVDNDGDQNNFFINLSTANVKAIGIIPDYGTDSTALDGEISFNSTFSWDFNPDNGISSGSFDFVAVATHEIGHALGFLSGVDVLDQNSPNGTTYYNDNQFTHVSPLDLYRYSAQSRASGVIDWTADSRTKYFSIDAGLSSLGGFSTGRFHGDGRQASHWKDNLGLGLLDPTLASGEIGQISALDRLAFDVIGYDTLSRVPAPLPLLGGSTALLWSRRLRQRRAQGRRPGGWPPNQPPPKRPRSPTPGPSIPTSPSPAPKRLTILRSCFSPGPWAGPAGCFAWSPWRSLPWPCWRPDCPPPRAGSGSAPWC
jgi:hypothetical protein